MDLARLSPEIVTERIRRLLDGYATRTAIIGTNGVFRARINCDSKSQFTHASQLWYPPPSAVVSAGRFNRVGQSKFYVCNHPWAALLEVQPDVGDRITLLVIRSNLPAAELNCVHVGIGAGKEDLGFGGPASSPNLARNPAFLASLREMGTERKWRLIDEYLTELAVKVPPKNIAQDHYKATNAIAEIFGGIKTQQGLLYPSVATDLNSHNLALEPATADDFFSPFEAWQFEILSHRSSLTDAPRTLSGYFGVQVSARSEAIDEDGRIKWRPAAPEELSDLQTAIRRAHTGFPRDRAA